ncbi:unnamed protein product [Amoebophrya sp. A120]|nr:unnamed protein product [Amoebophrya sp. A120]|eukprot:GSA120T00021470001.1
MHRTNPIQMNAFWQKRVQKEKESAEKALYKQSKSQANSKNTTMTSNFVAANVAAVSKPTYAPIDKSKRAWLPGGLNHSTPPGPPGPKGNSMLKGQPLPAEWYEEKSTRQNTKETVNSTNKPMYLPRNNANKPVPAGSSAASSVAVRPAGKETLGGPLGLKASESVASSSFRSRKSSSSRFRAKEGGKSTAPALTQDQLLRSIANIDKNAAPAAKSNGARSGRASSSRWRGSFNPESGAASEMAGSAGEAQFQEEIRSVVEQEVTKLLAPLEKQLQEERERREKAEALVQQLKTKGGK